MLKDFKITERAIRRLLIADNHLIVAEGLAKIFSGLADTTELVSSGDQLLSSIRRNPPDLVIAETELPNVSGINAMKVARSEGCVFPFLFLTRRADVHGAATALRWGARGYLTKVVDQAELKKAATTVLAGRIYCSDAALAPPMSPKSGFSHGLTDTQVSIVRQLGQGLRAKQIAYGMGLSTRTIEHHKYVITQKLGVHGAVELVSKARGMGII